MPCWVPNRAQSRWPPAPPWFPPLVLLAATHSIAVLVRTRASGLTCWCALAMTLGAGIVRVRAVV
jgi:hypothetical protein